MKEKPSQTFGDCLMRVKPSITGSLSENENFDSGGLPVDSPASRFWGFFLVIYFGFVDTSDIKRTSSGLWNGRTPQTDWDKRTRFYRDPCVWLGLSEIFAKSQHHLTTLQQNFFKTSQKFVFLATLLNRLFSSNNVIRIDLNFFFFD